MSAIVWSKWFWSDWLSDHLLRRCSPAARGLWMDLMALSMQSEPMGYLVDGEREMPVAEIARNCSMRKEQVARLMAELEHHRVFSRDERGWIHSRRIVREVRALSRNKANGSRGGNPQLAAKNDQNSDNPHKPESKSQAPESIDRAALVASPQAPILRAADAMGTTLDALHRKPAWLIFGDMFQTWVQDGCDAERDIWPTLRARTLKRRGKVPASPAYFTEAVREARDRRLESPNCALGSPYLASTSLCAPAFVTSEQWAERARVFAAHGHWSRRWGPKPGEAGSMVAKTEVQ